MKQQVKIYKVKGNPKNPRVIKNDKFKSLKNSIKTLPNYMKLRPVILNEDMMVLGGNMRLKASIDLGKKEIWTDMFTQADCDEMNEIAIEEKRETKTYLEYCDEIIIKDNVSAGDWEWDMLANEWDSVQLNDFGLDVWENEDDKVTEGLIEDDEIPEVKESIVKRGDIWQLGEHRVMCGDSTSSDDVEKLMNGEKADMVFTDPPFPNNSEIMHDMIIDIDKAFTNARNYCDNLMIWFWDNISFPEFGEMVTTKHIWHKTNGWQAGHFETMYGYHNDNKRHEQLVFNANSVGINNKRETQGFHLTPKPLELPILIFEKLKFKNFVLDLFLGSGSTLMACEKTNRKCYGMELDEKYCDVIINRWEQFTGLKATIINGTK